MISCEFTQRIDFRYIKVIRYILCMYEIGSLEINRYSNLASIVHSVDQIFCHLYAHTSLNYNYVIINLTAITYLRNEDDY